MNKKYNSGLTLIEIIIALAILGIIIVAFLSMFTTGYTVIFSMGNNTKAVAEAQTLMDKIYKTGSISDTTIQTIITGTDFEKATNSSEFDAAYNNKRIRYWARSETISGSGSNLNNDIISLKVFYQNGKRFITLTSVIP